MHAFEKSKRSIWVDKNTQTVKVIDQRYLPHKYIIYELKTLKDVITAIKQMVVRGAPLIGVTAAYGVSIILQNTPSGVDETAYLLGECEQLKNARPTAINLVYAVDRVLEKILAEDELTLRKSVAMLEAGKLAEEEVENCRRIGEYGVALIKELSVKKNGGQVNILTHCNAGRLACVEYGTATAPIYKAHDLGINTHVWVDETRPLNQGARLTAWELGEYGINHTVITDNCGGHLMQHGLVDMVIVGTDRSTYTGDVANKIGTYLKALAAKDNNIPFWVALPSSTFDWDLDSGVDQIKIEERNPDEVRFISGELDGSIQTVSIMPATSRAANYAFDVTPARLVSGFITERGICKASEVAIRQLFPEKVLLDR